MPPYLIKFEQRKTYLKVKRYHIHKSYLICSSLWINRGVDVLEVENTFKTLKSTWISVGQGGTQLHF